MIEENSFKKKRQEFLFTIRKTNRQQILMKRRNIQDHSTQQLNYKKSIIDQNFRSYITEVLQMTFQPTSLKQLLSMVQSGNIYDKHKAIIGIRKLTVTQSIQFMNQLINKQVISLLVNLCQQSDYPQIKLQALWILTNISSISKQASKLEVECGLIPIISTALDHSNKTIVHQAIWLAGNLAADSIHYRDQLISANSIMKIIKFLDSNNTNERIVNAVWTLTNLSRGTPPPIYDEVKAVIPVISQVIKSKIITNQNTLSDCLWTLTNLSDGPKIRVQRILQTKVLPTVMQYLRHPNYSISVPAIRIVGNFTLGNKQHTNEVLKNNFLDHAMTLLDNEKLVIIKQTCWTLSNITAGNDEQILQFLQRDDLIKKLLSLYKKSNIYINTEIIWIFTNLQRLAIPQMILKLYLHIDIINMIHELFLSNDSKFIVDLLICLNRLLHLGEKCKKYQSDPNPLAQQCYKMGLPPKIQQLSTNDLQKIRNLSHNLLQLYFPATSQMNDS